MISATTHKYYAYTHAHPSGEVFYVGKGCGIRARNFNGRSSWHSKVVSKIGGPCAVRVAVIPCASESAALSVEKVLIKAYRLQGARLCNITDGGEGVAGMRHTPEARAKISAAAGNMSAETREKMSLAHKGKAPCAAAIAIAAAMKRGKPLSPETRAKLSASKKGKPRSPQATARAAAALRGRPRPPEVIAKMSAAQKAIPKVTCPHCGLCGGVGGMHRYHFDNCKKAVPK